MQFSLNLRTSAPLHLGISIPQSLVPCPPRLRHVQVDHTFTVSGVGTVVSGLKFLAFWGFRFSSVAITRAWRVQVDHTFTVSGVGTVVSGRLLAGTVSVGDFLMLGPLELGSFSRVQVTGIQRAQVRDLALLSISKSPALPI